jgi:hypothetical protein
MITYIIGYTIVALCGPIYAIIYWKRIPKTLSEWVTIPTDFGAPDNERLDVTIHNLEEAINTSEELQKFCKERNIDEKKAYYSAITLEELCLGIIKDRFELDKKKHRIEVRVVHKGENFFMCIKDDCKPFNAKDTTYQLTLEINVFTVTV